jgi:hypothetical protein
MPKHLGINAGTGSYKTNGKDAKLLHSFWKKNPKLICFYMVVTFAGIILSYFTSKACSVGLPIVVAGVTFLIGKYMMWQVIREK